MSYRIIIIKVLLLFCFFLSNVPSYSKVFKISQNELSFEKQLTTLLDEINRMPGNERCVIIIDKGH